MDWGETFQLLVDGVTYRASRISGTTSSPVEACGKNCRPMSSHGASAEPQEWLTTRAGGGWDHSVIQEMVNKTAQFVSNAAASLYAALLPTADIVNAIVTMLPAWHRPVPRWSSQQVLSGDIIGGLLQRRRASLGCRRRTGHHVRTDRVLVIANAITGIFTIDCRAGAGPAIQAGPAHRPYRLVRRTGDSQPTEASRAATLMHLVLARFLGRDIADRLVDLWQSPGLSGVAFA